MNILFTIFEFVGTISFAVSGAMEAIRHKMDLFGVVMLGIITAFTLLLLDLQPPAMLMSAGKYVANTVTPLALIYSGFILYEVGVKNLRLLPGLPAMLVIRLVLAPVMCWGVCLLLGVAGLAREVFIVMAALPVMSQVPVLCGVYGADEKYAAIGASLSMLGMFVTLPVIMLLIG